MAGIANFFDARWGEEVHVPEVDLYVYDWISVDISCHLDWHDGGYRVQPSQYAGFGRVDELTHLPPVL